MIEKTALEYKTALSKYQYELFAREAARDYLSRDISLNQSIEKIANDNELTSKQIERVCEIANKEVYLHLYKKGNAGEKTSTSESYDKYVTFDLADATKILSSMNKEASIAVSNPTDYFANIPHEFQKDIADIDIRVPAMEKTAAPNQNAAYDLLNKLESAGQMLNGKFAVSEMKLAASKEKFYTTVRTSLLNKEATLKALHKMARSFCKTKVASVDEAFKDILTTMQNRDQDLFIKVASAVDEDLISSDLDELVPDTGVQIINGRHPVFYELNTIIPQYEDTHNLRERLVIYDHHVKYLKNRIFSEV